MNLKEMETELGISRCETAKKELQFTILKAQENIKTMEDHIKLQDKRVIELKKELHGDK